MSFNNCPTQSILTTDKKVVSIEANELIKEYKLGQLQGIKQKFVAAIDRITSNSPTPAPLPFKALDSVSFTVENGEVLGVIGSNGAGKSTLLKLLAGVTTPTRGSLKINGTLAPLIEIGAGFHPELTGRENIFLNGAIMGLSKKVIKEKFDEIVNFAELDEFIDTPIKRYSSGMAIRLGFAVAISVDPEILIIDEVLAVGDIAFQRKCFDRMERLIKDKGKTIILVSHNIRQVERICTRVILLEHGRVIKDGSPEDVCSLFFQRSNKKIFSYFSDKENNRSSIESSGEISQLQVTLIDDTGKPNDEILTGGTLRLHLDLTLESPISKVELVVGTHTTDFFYLTANSTATYPERIDLSPGNHRIEFSIPLLPLTPGIYCIRVAIFDGNRRLLFMGESLKYFSVVPRKNEARQPQLRSIDVDSCWKIDGQILVGKEYGSKANE